MPKLRERLTYANVMSTIAVFGVLAGGTAYAANTVFTTDIVNNEVFASDVRDDTLAYGGLGHVDLRPGSVRASEVDAGSIGPSELNASAFLSEDISRFSLNSPFDIANNAIQSAEVTNGTLLGADIDETTLGGFDGHDDYLDHCDTPQDNTFRECVSVTFELGHAMQVLATFGGGASHGSYTGDNEKAYGECQVRLDGADKLEPIAMENSGSSNTGMPTISDVMSLQAGTHTVALACRENPEDLEFEDLTIAVVELGFD